MYQMFIHGVMKAIYFNNRGKVVEEENITKTLLKFHICQDHFVECVCMCVLA
jgi:hypothetical protein